MDTTAAIRSEKFLKMQLDPNPHEAAGFALRTVFRRRREPLCPFPRRGPPEGIQSKGRGS